MTCCLRAYSSLRLLGLSGWKLQKSRQGCVARFRLLPTLNCRILNFKSCKEPLPTSMWISKLFSGKEQVAVRGQGGPEDGEREWVLLIITAIIIIIIITRWVRLQLEGEGYLDKGKEGQREWPEQRKWSCSSKIKVWKEICDKFFTGCPKNAG